jgi:CRP-like cAMP-binding protein
VSRTLGTRLDEMQSRIAELATQAVEQRVAAALLRLVNQSGRKVEDGIEIAFPVTRQNIADMAGTTLHTVSRLLSAWEKDGLVRSTRRHVVVTAPHRLVVLSGGGGG